MPRREQRIVVRVTPEEAEDLERKAREAGYQTVTAYVRAKLRLPSTRQQAGRVEKG